MRSSSPALLLVCLLATGALVACSSSPNAAWQKASARGTIDSYQLFIKQHPSDPRVQQARDRIDALEDTQAWQTAKNAATVQAYGRYLSRYPDGAYTVKAQDALARLKAASAWRHARSAGTATAYEAFVHAFPNAGEASAARAEIDKLAGYQIELGRFRSTGAANAAAGRIKTRFAGVLTEVQVVPPSGANPLTTLRSQQMSHAAALAACRRLRRARQRCAVVKIQAKSGGLTLSGV